MEPRVARTAHAIDASRLRRIESLLASTALPLSMEAPPIGLDGVSYILQLRDGLNSVSARWWHKGPANWSPVSACFREIWDVLQELSAAANT